MKEFYNDVYTAVTEQIKVVRKKVNELLSAPEKPLSENFTAYKQTFRLLSYLRKVQKVASESLVYECNKENAADRAKREAVKVPF